MIGQWAKKWIIWMYVNIVRQSLSMSIQLIGLYLMDLLYVTWLPMIVMLYGNYPLLTSIFMTKYMSFDPLAKVKVLRTSNSPESTAPDPFINQPASSTVVGKLALGKKVLSCNSLELRSELDGANRSVSVTRVVSPTAGAVVPDPTAVWLTLSSMT